MSRWEPDAQGRLRRAALELFEQRGFEQTTVAEIATRAGLTERTFFRHFADKREVLFRGSEELVGAITSAIAAAPASASPLDAVAAGLAAGGGGFHREFSGRRQAIILANPELQERELVKLAGLSAAIAAALQHRGVAPPAAELAGQTGVALFRVAFDRWLEDPAPRPYEVHVEEALTDLRSLTAAAG
jgi:AcrR family transcriptional regulator